jgi:hypothetical protein
MSETLVYRQALIANYSVRPKVGDIDPQGVVPGHNGRGNIECEGGLPKNSCLTAIHPHPRGFANIPKINLDLRILR